MQTAKSLFASAFLITGLAGMTASAASAGPAASAAKRAAPAAKTAAADYHWYYYNLDTTGEYNGENRLRFDAKGNVKVGYQGKYVAKYAELIDHVFKVETADTSFTAGDSKLDMALDKDGHPHILYHRWNYSAVNYAWHDGKKWSHKDFGPLGLDLLDFYQLAIEVDSKGSAHMIYPVSGKEYYFPSVAYIRVDADGKATEPVLLGGASLQGKYVSLALDKKEQPVASHYTFDGSNLTVSYLDADAWKYQVIDSSQFVRTKGFLNSMAALPNGDFVIATENHTQLKIQVAIGKPGSEWKIQDLDTLVGHTHGSSKNPVAADADGLAYVAYPRMVVNKDTVVSSRLMLAVQKDTTWTIDVVDSSDMVGEYASLAINPVTKLPAIAYYDRKNKRLRVAIARKEAPVDANNNGVPDYQEPVSIRKRLPGKRGALPKRASAIDASGRTQPAAPRILFQAPRQVAH